MVKILLNLNVNIVVQLLNGFVGEIHIFVNLAIKNNVMEIMLASILYKNCQNAQDQSNVQQEVIIMEMGKKELQDVQYVETTKQIVKIFDHDIYLNSIVF